MRIGQPESSMTIWDEGTYPFKVVGVEVGKSTYPGKEDQTRLKFRLLVSNESGETTEIWHWTNATLSTHKLATFRPLVRALLPEADLDDPSFEVDTDELVGKRGRVMLGIDEEKGRNTVEKVLPAQSRSATPARERAAQQGPVPTVAQRRAAAAVAEPEIEDDEMPPF